MDTLPAERMAPAVPLTALADELRAHGHEISTLLERVGLREQDVAGPDRRAPVSAIAELFRLAVQLTGDPGLPLRVGARCGLAWAGVLGTAARHAATLGEALTDLEWLPELRDTVGAVALRRVGEEAHFSYHLDVADVVDAPLLYQAALAIMCATIDELTGGTVKPWIVRLPQRRPADLAPYRRHLGPRLQFDAMVGELVFHADALPTPLSSADPHRRRAILAEVERQVSRREPRIRVIARNAIQSLLVHGTCTRAQVAAHLRVNERVLCRRLQNAGTSFRDLLDEERAVRARLLLRHTGAGVQRIGRALGYRDSTVFGRAFRRWTGLLPGDYRAQFSPAADSSAAQDGGGYVRSARASALECRGL